MNIPRTKSYSEYKKLVMNDKQSDKFKFLIDGRLYYVYRVTEIKTQNYYYGSRIQVKNDVNEDFWSYCTSSERKQIIKNHKELYKVKILKIFDNINDMIIYESFLHQYFNVKYNIKFFNKANQTPTFFNVVAWNKGKTSKEDSRILAAWNKGLTKHVDDRLMLISTKMIDISKNRSPDYYTKTGRDMSNTNNPMYGRKHSVSSKKKISEKALCRIPFTDEERVIINLKSYQSMQQIDNNGLSKMTNSHIKQVQTVKNTILVNGLTIEENSQLKRIRTMKEKGINKGHRNSAAKYFNVFISDEHIGILWSRDVFVYLKNRLSKSEIQKCLKGAVVNNINLQQATRFEYFSDKNTIKLKEKINDSKINE